ncbi:hypothetical protein [Alysiella crassa]|uniref:Uncharacterized protein n=1 Tax=Alysiella crassa TaxID=153491 RepID=A0A376BUF8_9NEIS|nr:hypothetical protein [Alysiella crassa]UOP06169.1 hypothetical protein LVJ80_10075 [Alysiella crassa]SSY80642.1 Uncharacterised protein [Alysiella crassa]
MDTKESLEIQKAKQENAMAWEKHRLEMKISYDNHQVDLEKKKIANDVARSKAKWVFWFALLTFLNAGFAIFNLISNIFK